MSAYRRLLRIAWGSIKKIRRNKSKRNLRAICIEHYVLCEWKYNAFIMKSAAMAVAIRA